MNYLTVENEIPENQLKIQKINQHVGNKKPVVIYFYKNGCPFCERTTPEWDKLPNYLSPNNDLLVVRMNKDYYEKLQSVGDKPALYPNIRYVHGSRIDTFKKEGDERNAKNLAMWIQQQPQQQQLQQQPSYISYVSPQIKKLYRPRHNNPKYKNKKSFKKRKHKKHNKFTKRRRMYYM
jgi:thiol-disulfide isomerase/thioredoxin